MNITVTETAEEYLKELLSKQDVEGMAVRMFVTQPGTSYAETCLAYCRPDEVIEDDEILELTQLRFYIEKNSVPYLDEAHVDFAKDRMGGQLTIKAPNAKVPKVSPDSPISEQINYILYSEINPGLASHGGEVKLMEVVEEEEGNIAVLQFGGGCQGCSAVDMTLKDGVEKTLVERIETLVGVRDITDHSVTDKAYYK
ncbi:Fe-S biogenesis protein NfuA [Neptuniibacter sp. SY11_33]|uniref:Fe-S biogenesis protein NfuA n=1 Tax=unclassified Neptuniibacter TaxID=2630693 RepID=UPI0039F6696F